MFASYGIKCSAALMDHVTVDPVFIAYHLEVSLTLTHERIYAVPKEQCLVCVGSSIKANKTSAAGRPLGKDTSLGTSAFEDAFGRLDMSASGMTAGGLGEETVAMDIDSQGCGSSRPWRHLFDAPSHALPSACSLAQSYLMLVTASEK
jgi:hypothetical protein